MGEKTGQRANGRDSKTGLLVGWALPWRGIRIPVEKKTINGLRGSHRLSLTIFAFCVIRHLRAWKPASRNYSIARSRQQIGSLKRRPPGNALLTYIALLYLPW